jgi:hypothetical protein
MGRSEAGVQQACRRRILRQDGDGCVRLRAFYFLVPVICVISSGRSSGVSCVVGNLLHKKLFDTLLSELVCKLEWRAWINVLLGWMGCPTLFYDIRHMAV